eukprot:s1249_g2.t2
MPELGRPAAQRRHQMLQELVRERVLRGVWRRYVGILKARLVSLAALPWSISARPCIVPAGLATFRSVGKAYWATLALTCRRSPQLLARRSKRAAAPARPEPQVMSVKSIREQDGKALLKRWLPEYSNNAFGLDNAGCLVSPGVLDSSKGEDWNTILEKNPWLKTEKLVAKPDQMIGGRGKAGLIAVNKTFDEIKAWIMERMCKETTVGGITGQLTHFLIEPFVPHAQSEEVYVCMQSHRYKDPIFFYHEGGVDVGDVDAKASRLSIPTGCEVSEDMIRSELLDKVEPGKSATLARFVKALFAFYRDLHFAYLEINPIALLSNNKIVPLDLVAKIDETAAFLCTQKWGELDWPSPFGRAAYPEEALIRELDGKTGASLKLTILNDKGRVWTMVAGGGASVVYSDTVADYGWGKELANYGEYSGAPTTEETFTYAKTILSLMCRYKHPEGKFLIIGGGIANFTDVAATFTGLIKALQMFADQIKEHKIHIWCRRAGPNYLEGLKKLKVASDKLGLGVKVGSSTVWTPVGDARPHKIVSFGDVASPPESQQECPCP